MFFKKDKPYSISERKGIHTIIVQPDENKSAYMLFTNDSNYGHMMEALSNLTDKDYTDFSHMRNSEIAQYAGIYELPYINRYTIETNISDAMKKLTGRDTADITVIKQSQESEKFLVNVLNTYVDANGKLNAYTNNGVYDYLTSWRMNGSKGLDYILDGDFEKFTKSLRNQQNKKLQKL